MIGGAPSEHRAGATGKPLSHCEAKLLDLANRPVTEPDSPGVLWARMSSLCREYWRQPQKSAAAFRDGWYRTGDVFTVDREGWWRHQGRADDLLKISGQWVSPTEIEECAIAVPGVSEAIAVGAQDEDGLVRLTLFLVTPTENREAVHDAVRDRLLGTLSRYKCPRRIVFVDAIPRTATGKARRFQLRNWIIGAFMPRLMRRLGLNPAEIERTEPQRFRDMQSKCAMCESHDRCAADLDQGNSASRFAEYCPNADVLVSLRVSGPAVAGRSPRPGEPSGARL